jgi:hypothetical protein
MKRKSVHFWFRSCLAMALVAMLLAASMGRPLAGATALPAIGGGSDTMVLRWNLIAVQAIGAAPPFPATRAMATVQLAVFEAVNAITHRYQPYLGTVGAPEGASSDASVVTSAHDTLLWLFPAQQNFLDSARDASLAAIRDGKAKDDGIAVGRAAAMAMIANRTNDGSQTPMFYTPITTVPYEWQATPGCANAPANGRGLFFHWQFVKPFGVESATQFRAEAPPNIAGGKYAKDLNEIAAVGSTDSTLRTSHEADVARFYAVQPPHRGWNLVARQLASLRSDEITRTARTLAILNMSLADGHITVFETKYHYRGWRPETAIHRADEDGNDKTAADRGWRPYIVTPCFPGYPSAHAIGGGAGRTILWRAYGRKDHDITMVDDAIPDVVLRYTDLVDITDDVTIARVFGGIHFRVDQDVGDRMGTEVARYNDDHWLLAVDSEDELMR